MSNSISYSRPKWDLWMAAALVCVAVVLGIYPADRTVWCVEMVWAVGLWAILLLTRRRFRFSTIAYLCFFVWTILQLVGAHYTFEHVPMDWLMKPLGLVRNPYDRIAHFAVGWFAFPLAELFFRKGWAKSAGFAAFSYENICQYAKSLWRFPQQSQLLDVSLSPIRNVGRLCSEA